MTVLQLHPGCEGENWCWIWYPANKFLDPSVSFLNYKHTEFLGSLWSPSKPSCWETWMSFSFWRSQSRYPISRGWKNSNIWSSSKWKHLHCHLFGFLLFSCWMWITQRHPNMSVMAVYTLRKLSPAQVTCVFVALEIKHLLFRFPLNVPVCISHATPCWYLLLVWKTLVNHFSPSSALLYLRLLIWPVRNWWHNHSWLHVADTEQKTQEIPKRSELTKSSVTKKGRKHRFLVVYRNFKVLLSYKSFWATGLPQEGCAFEGESLEIRPWVIKEMLVPLQTKLIAEEIK